jgi:hypothetical protein
VDDDIFRQAGTLSKLPRIFLAMNVRHCDYQFALSKIGVMLVRSMAINLPPIGQHLTPRAEGPKSAAAIPAISPLLVSFSSDDGAEVGARVTSQALVKLPTPKGGSDVSVPPSPLRKGRYENDLLQNLLKIHCKGYDADHSKGVKHVRNTNPFKVQFP